MCLVNRPPRRPWKTGASRPFEREYVCKDGSRVPVLVGPVLLQRDPLRVVNFVIDLTERKQLEQALTERVTQLEAVMEAVPGSTVGLRHRWPGDTRQCCLSGASTSRGDHGSRAYPARRRDVR